MFTGFDLPNITPESMNDASQQRRIMEYLYQLTEQLRYVLNNLDETNLSNDLSSMIYTSSNGIGTLEKMISQSDNALIAVKSFVESITLAVDNGSDHSVISLIAGGAPIVQRNIGFTHAVMSEDLIDGLTQISASNLLTGTIPLERIDIDEIYVRHLSSSGADGVFNGSLSDVTGTLDNVSGTFGSFDGTGHLRIGGVLIDQSGLDLLGAVNTARFHMNPPVASSGIEARWIDEGTHYSLGVYTSSRTGKKDIDPIDDECSQVIDRLRPVYFRFNSDADDSVRSVGFIAEDVADVFPEITAYGPDRVPSGVQYSNITALLVAELQRLRRRVSILENVIAGGNKT